MRKKKKKKKKKKEEDPSSTSNIRPFSASTSLLALSINKLAMKSYNLHASPSSSFLILFLGQQSSSSSFAAIICERIIKEEEEEREDEKDDGKWWSSRRSSKLSWFRNGKRPSSITGNWRSTWRRSSSRESPPNPLIQRHWSNGVLPAPRSSTPFAPQRRKSQTGFAAPPAITTLSLKLWFGYVRVRKSVLQWMRERVCIFIFHCSVLIKLIHKTFLLPFLRPSLFILCTYLYCVEVDFIIRSRKL